MAQQSYVTFMGTVPSLKTIYLETPDKPMDLLVKSYAPYRRYAIQIQDDGMNTFGIKSGDYIIFKEQRWPSNEGQICLVTLGDETTIRMLEYINNPTVTLRVGSDHIEPIELGNTDFCVIGVLDGIIKEDLAVFADQEDTEFDWGC